MFYYPFVVLFPALTSSLLFERFFFFFPDTWSMYMLLIHVKTRISQWKPLALSTITQPLTVLPCFPQSLRPSFTISGSSGGLVSTGWPGYTYSLTVSRGKSLMTICSKWMWLENVAIPFSLITFSPTWRLLPLVLPPCTAVRHKARWKDHHLKMKDRSGFISSVSYSSR